MGVIGVPNESHLCGALFRAAAERDEHPTGDPWPLKIERGHNGHGWYFWCQDGRGFPIDECPFCYEILEG